MDNEFIFGNYTIRNNALLLEVHINKILDLV